MTEFELAKVFLNKVVSEDVPFAVAIKSVFKKEGVTDGTVRSNVQALVGCELRHHYLLDNLMERFFPEASFESSIYTRFMVANHLFLKRFPNKDLYLLAIKDFPKDKVDELVDYLNTTDEIIPTNDKNSPQYLSLRFNTPSWIIKMWQKQYGMGLVFKILKITVAYLIMGILVVGFEYVLNAFCGDYLKYHFFFKLVVLGVLGAWGLACFLGLALAMHILSLSELLKTFLKKARG